jgi:hypothetical protein
MISYCPFCADILPERLIDGFILCPKCNKIIESSRKNILLAAYKILKKKQYTNLKQFKFEMQLDDADFEIILEAYEIDCLTLQEFEKKIKTLVVA